MQLGWHLIIRFVDDRTIAPDPHYARRMIRSVARIVGTLSVFAFSVCGSHGHIGFLGDRETAGELARRLEIGLWQVLGHGVRWEPARIRPIHDQAHLRNVFWYILRQPRHHQLDADPFFEASNLPDLIGARISLKNTRGVVRSHLPSVRGAALLEEAGLTAMDVALPLEPRLLRDAAAAAVALPQLYSSSNLACTVRAAAIQVGQAVLPAGELADALEIAPRSLRRDRRREVPEELRRAVAIQWHWRSHRQNSAEVALRQASSSSLGALPRLDGSPLSPMWQPRAS